MLRTSWQWLKHRLIQLAANYPQLMVVLIFLFLLTLSNQVYFATGIAVQIPIFWHMLVMGTLMATYGAFLLYEVIRLHGRLAEARLVRTVASTLHHEINNPLMVIQLSAEKLQTLRTYDETTVQNILTQGARIRDALLRLSKLEEEVRLRKEQGFAGLIDIPGSR